ncbi:MAG: NAD(P)/FAD-dependent oxidoreductase [Bacteroidota bacterium]
MSKRIKTDICIIGTGPAGSTASLFLSKNGIDHLILDKEEFPRNKICGDALTIEVMATLKRLNPDLLQSMINNPEFLPVWKVEGSSPKGNKSEINFNHFNLPYAPFYTSKRSVFDTFLIDSIKKCDFLGNTLVKKINRKTEGVEIRALKGDEEIIINSKLVLGCDGSNSVVSRQLANYPTKDRAHTYASVRTYFKLKFPVESLEFHFLKELLPGYFWVFPMPDGSANVGLGVMSNHIKIKERKLLDLFNKLINEDKSLKEKFAGSEQLEKLRGWDLPLNSKRKTLAGNNYLLLGDAGSMIEPFSGKGIGIAMVSGMLALNICQAALEKNRFDEAFLMQYHHKVYQYFNIEWKFLYLLQKWHHNPFRVDLLNAVHGFPPINRYLNRKLEKSISQWM